MTNNSTAPSTAPTPRRRAGRSTPQHQVRIEYHRWRGHRWAAYIPGVAVCVATAARVGDNCYTLYARDAGTVLRNPKPHAGHAGCIFVGKRAALDALVNLALEIQSRQGPRRAILRDRWMRLQCRRVLIGEDTDDARRIARLQSAIERRLWFIAPAVLLEFNQVEGLSPDPFSN